MRDQAARKIVLCGGGNGTHTLAGLLGVRRSLDVHVVTRDPTRWQDRIRCVETRVPSAIVPHFSPSWKVEHEGHLAGVHGWDEIDEVLRGADLVLLGCPVNVHPVLLDRILPALDGEQTAVGTLYAQGGFDWHARRVAAERGVDLSKVTIFGLKRFPFLCKVDEYGRSVRLHGRFTRTLYAVDDVSKPRVAGLGELLGELFEKPVERLPHFVTCALTLSNQLLHPSIAWGILRGYEPGKTTFDEPPAFYGSCTAAGAETEERGHGVGHSKQRPPGASQNAHEASPGGRARPGLRVEVLD